VVAEDTAAGGNSRSIGRTCDAARALALAHRGWPGSILLGRLAPATRSRHWRVLRLCRWSRRHQRARRAGPRCSR